MFSNHKVITVALRCPDGAVKRRRFTVESQIKVMLTIHCTIHKHIDVLASLKEFKQLLHLRFSSLIHCVIHFFLTIPLFYRRPRLWETVRESMKIYKLRPKLNFFYKNRYKTTHLVFLFCYSLEKKIQIQIHCKWKRSCDRENCEGPVTCDKTFDH